MRNFVTSFVVGKAGGGANVGTSLETIKKGDVLIVDYNSGAVLTGANNTVDTNPVIVIAHAIEDGKPLVSGPIYGKKLVAGSKNAYVAPVQPVKGVGYTSASTSSELPTVTEEATFSAGIVLKTDLRLHPNRQDRIDISVRSLGGYDLARKLTDSLSGAIDRNPVLYDKKYVFGRVTSDGTPTNIGTSATATVTKGSKTVTFSAVHGLSAGAYLDFPTVGVYKVANIDSTTVVTLDAPYAGESEVIAADTVKEQDGAAKFGFEVVGVKQERTNPVDSYSQVDFELGLSENFGMEAVTVTEYKPGVGTGWQVRDMEVSCLGFNGYTDRLDTMRAEYPFQSVITSNYLTYSISSMAPVRGDLQQSLEGPQSVFIAFDNAASTQSTAVMAILTPWAASGGVDLS